MKKNKKKDEENYNLKRKNSNKFIDKNKIFKNFQKFLKNMSSVIHLISKIRINQKNKFNLNNYEFVLFLVLYWFHLKNKWITKAKDELGISYKLTKKNAAYFLTHGNYVLIKKFPVKNDQYCLFVIMWLFKYSSRYEDQWFEKENKIFINKQCDWFLKHVFNFEDFKNDYILMKNNKNLDEKDFLNENIKLFTNSKYWSKNFKDNFSYLSCEDLMKMIRKSIKDLSSLSNYLGMKSIFITDELKKIDIDKTFLKNFFLKLNLKSDINLNKKLKFNYDFSNIFKINSENELIFCKHEIKNNKIEMENYKNLLGSSLFHEIIRKIRLNKINILVLYKRKYSFKKISEDFFLMFPNANIDFVNFNKFFEKKLETNEKYELIFSNKETEKINYILFDDNNYYDKFMSEDIEISLEIINKFIKKI